MSRVNLNNSFLHVEEILLNALKEDIGNNDITTNFLVPESQVSCAVLIAKSDFILAGLPYAKKVFGLVDKKIQFKTLKKEGSRIKAGNVIAKIKGKTRNLLMAERTALNFLQRLSGIATLANEYVSKIEGFKVKIVDTRKTAPCLRIFDKYAVKIGGGHNHRYGLFDGLLIKDNHIKAVGGINKAVKLARLKAHHLLKIEIEVKNLTDVKKALSAGVDVIMLDNMSVDEIKRAVILIRSANPGTIIEASGNIDLDNVYKIAETGVDLISVGAITHSTTAADLSMKIVSSTFYFSRKRTV